MINWKSILSSFNDKPTLLEWLKLVEKALKESVLTNVDTKTQDGKTSFIFKFEDGTEIATDYIETRGDTGATGKDGISIIGIEEVSDEIVGAQTLTTIRAHYSNGETDEIPIYAQNGSVVNQTLATYRARYNIGSIRITAVFVGTYSENLSFDVFTKNIKVLSSGYNGDITAGGTVNYPLVDFNSDSEKLNLIFITPGNTFQIVSFYKDEASDHLNFSNFEIEVIPW